MMLALQTELTDTMISEAIAQKLEATQSVIWAVIGMIVLFILLLVGKMMMNRFKNRNRDEERPKKPLAMLVGLIAFVGVAGVIGVFIFSMNGAMKTNKQDQAHADEWHVEITKITDLQKEEKTTKKKKKNSKSYTTKTTTYYYAEVEGFDEKFGISASDYASFTKGEEVYAVVDYSNDVILLYSTEDFSYDGTRLK